MNYFEQILTVIIIFGIFIVNCLIYYYLDEFLKITKENNKELIKNNFITQERKIVIDGTQ